MPKDTLNNLDELEKQNIATALWMKDFQVKKNPQKCEDQDSKQ